jgi:hypothetical protein
MHCVAMLFGRPGIDWSRKRIDHLFRSLAEGPLARPVISTMRGLGQSNRGPPSGLYPELAQRAEQRASATASF